MKREGERPDVGRVLEGLKDFQRLTVDHVFRRFYEDVNPASRFLVADEVGLGKTVVARGLLARAIDHLWDNVDRIDIVYVCSNASIARQNVSRLRQGLGANSVPEADRLTLLPASIQQLDRNHVNLVAFTPGTSFDFRSSLGVARERMLLYRMLGEVWDIGGTGAMNLLQGNVIDRNWWRGALRNPEGPLEPTILKSFASEIGRGSGLRRRFDELREQFRYPRRQLPPADRVLRNQLIGDLRNALARSCLRALEPDIIILDEFQRFKHLLNRDNPAGELAHELFDYGDAITATKVLLLSATPYRMLTLQGEADDDHYADFLETIRFLSPNRTDEVTQLMRKYRVALLNLNADQSTAVASLTQSRDDIARCLRDVMVRTERLAGTDERRGMLREVTRELVPEPGDLRDYLALEGVASNLNQNGALTYWKSAPYTLSFMDEYQLKSELVVSIQEGLNPELAAALGDCALVDRTTVESYGQLDPRNARLRQLASDTVEVGAWKLLWIPPAAPYYKLSRAYADPHIRDFTKRLVFSGWRVVPKSLSTLLSYEAERQMMLTRDKAARYQSAADRDRPLLRFTRSAGRLTGMPVLSLIYPSSVLADELDPLVIGRPIEPRAGQVSARDLLRAARQRVEQLLSELGPTAQEGRPDERWYWAAAMMIDRRRYSSEVDLWWDRPDLPAIWSAADTSDDGEEISSWGEHVALARQVIRGEQEPLGRMPSDLSRVLAMSGLAGPGTSALRALQRVAGSGASSRSTALRDAAAGVGWGFRTLFNLPDVQALVRSGSDSRYWQQVLAHCLDGCLQAVLDEYAHLLREQTALVDEPPESIARSVADEIRTSLQLRTPVLSVDEVLPSGEEKHLRVRTRFARRLDAEEVEGSPELQRETQVRAAFNSPFWPFLLVSTSIGQEGLDFHYYCHAVVHWDLPSNPVDLEQREGRVHRYKGHAVRKNVAARHWAALFGEGRQDPWDRLFDAAIRDRPANATDLVPFWVYTNGASGAAIERHVLAYALSRDVTRLKALKRSLVLYRLAFGQPRQQDLLEYLMAALPQEEATRLMSELCIDLSPVPSR